MIKERIGLFSYLPSQGIYIDETGRSLLFEVNHQIWVYVHELWEAEF
jgi:hypothetical protein